MVSSLPSCMQGANTDACIHETCNVRTQMHADRNSAKCEHRDAMSVSESIDSSRLLMSASELRAKAHRRRLQQIKPTSTVFLVKSFRIEWVVVVVVDVVVAVVAPNLYLITSPFLLYTDRSMFVTCRTIGSRSHIVHLNLLHHGQQ